MDYEKIKAAILAAQAVSDRWDVQYSTEALLEGNDDLGSLAAQVQSLSNLEHAWHASCDPIITEAYECAIHTTLAEIADECVRLVLGDTAAPLAGAFYL